MRSSLLPSSPTIHASDPDRVTTRPENCAPRAVRQGPPAGESPETLIRRPSAPAVSPVGGVRRRSRYSSTTEEQGERLGYAEGRPPGWVIALRDVTSVPCGTSSPDESEDSQGHLT